MIITTYTIIIIIVVVVIMTRVINTIILIPLMNIQLWWCYYWTWYWLCFRQRYTMMWWVSNNCCWRCWWIISYCCCRCWCTIKMFPCCKFIDNIGIFLWLFVFLTEVSFFSIITIYMNIMRYLFFLTWYKSIHIFCNYNITLEELIFVITLTNEWKGLISIC